MCPSRYWAGEQRYLTFCFLVLAQRQRPQGFWRCDWFWFFCGRRVDVLACNRTGEHPTKGGFPKGCLFVGNPFCRRAVQRRQWTAGCLDRISCPKEKKKKEKQDTTMLASFSLARFDMGRQSDRYIKTFNISEHKQAQNDTAAIRNLPVGSRKPAKGSS